MSNNRISFSPPGFGTGSMIHDGFKIAQVFENGMSLDCFGPISIVVAVMHLLFCFFQTYFLFKSHNVSTPLI